MSIRDRAFDKFSLSGQATVQLRNTDDELAAVDLRVRMEKIDETNVFYGVLDVNIPNPGTLVDLAQTALHASVSSQQLPTKAEESIREFTEGMTDMSLSIVYASHEITIMDETLRDAVRNKTFADGVTMLLPDVTLPSSPSSDEDSNESGDSLVNTLKQVFPNPETMSPSFLLNFPAQAFGSDRRRLESNLKTYHHNEVVAYIFCTSNQRFKYSL